MANVQPEQAKFLLDSVYLPEVRYEFATTKKVMQAIPADQGDYRPDAISMTAMDLAWHIASSDLWFLEAVSAGKFGAGNNPRPDSVRNGAEMAAWYEERLEAELTKIAGLSGEQLALSLDFRGMFELPAVMYLGLSGRHLIHHRGQLSTYLRPMGAKVPAIYGESYDSAEARKAAQA